MGEIMLQCIFCAILPVECIDKKKQSGLVSTMSNKKTMSQKTLRSKSSGRFYGR